MDGIPPFRYDLMYQLATPLPYRGTEKCVLKALSLQPSLFASGLHVLSPGILLPERANYTEIASQLLRNCPAHHGTLLSVAAINALLKFKKRTVSLSLGSSFIKWPYQYHSWPISGFETLYRLNSGKIRLKYHKSSQMFKNRFGICCHQGDRGGEALNRQD